jgi:hypothetical protein
MHQDVDFRAVLRLIDLIEQRQPGIETLAVDQDLRPARDQTRIEPVPDCPRPTRLASRSN